MYPKDRPVVFDTTVKIENGDVIANCNTLNFYNAGTCTILMDGIFPLLPGMGYEYVCWPGEVNVKTYSITFLNPEGTLNQNLIITRKIYQDR